VRAEIDEQLLLEIQHIAKLQGRDESEVLQDAVRYFLTSYAYFAEALKPRSAGSADLVELLKRIDRGQRERGVEALSDYEAMRLADEELHAMRREQGTGR
jgi:metal-responsive CopG/Arc/MetJ family transcriptional regulator